MALLSTATRRCCASRDSTAASGGRRTLEYLHHQGRAEAGRARRDEARPGRGGARGSEAKEPRAQEKDAEMGRRGSMNWNHRPSEGLRLIGAVLRCGPVFATFCMLAPPSRCAAIGRRTRPCTTAARCLPPSGRRCGRRRARRPVHARRHGGLRRAYASPRDRCPLGAREAHLHARFITHDQDAHDADWWRAHHRHFPPSELKLHTVTERAAHRRMLRAETYCTAPALSCWTVLKQTAYEIPKYVRSGQSGALPRACATK